jgi:fructose-1,6-bisphosphatase/inositol monophosphatase family enzyme
VLVEEAGGLVTRFDGGPHRLAGGEILAAPPGLHPKMLEILTSPSSR